MTTTDRSRHTKLTESHTEAVYDMHAMPTPIIANQLNMARLGEQICMYMVKLILNCNYINIYR